MVSSCEWGRWTGWRRNAMTDLSYFEFNILIYLELVKIDKNGTKGPKEKKGEGRS